MNDQIRKQLEDLDNRPNPTPEEEPKFNCIDASCPEQPKEHTH